MKFVLAESRLGSTLMATRRSRLSCFAMNTVAIAPEPIFLIIL